MASSREGVRESTKYGLEAVVVVYLQKTMAAKTVEMKSRETTREKGGHSRKQQN